MKHLLGRSSDESIANGSWRSNHSLNPYSLLVSALCEMLQLVAAADRPVRIVHVIDVAHAGEEMEKCDSTTEAAEKNCAAAADEHAASAEAQVTFDRWSLRAIVNNEGVLDS